MVGKVNSINESTTGITGFTGTSFTGTPVTQFDVIVGGATSSTLTSVGPGTAGQVLQSGGNAANPAYSTATYPSTAGTAANVLTSDGTNWVSSVPALGTTHVVTGTSTSGTAGTTVATLSASGSNWLYFTALGLSGIGSSLLAITVTYADSTTSSYTTAPGGLLVSNNGGASSSGDNTATLFSTTKKIVTVTLKTASNGTGTRWGMISAIETA